MDYIAKFANKIASLTIAGIFSAGIAFAAQAGESKVTIFNIAPASQTFAYAAPEKGRDVALPEAFSEEDFIGHELNDAWLGMPAFSSDGKMVGIVEDAYLDESGNVTEILVNLNTTDRNYSVYVGGEHAVLTDTEVGISLSEQTIAGLERAEGVMLSSN